MNPEALFTMSATVVNRSQSGPPDKYGNPTISTTETVWPCEFQPRQIGVRGQDESRSGLSTTQEHPYLIWLPPACVIDGRSAVIVNGDVYEVDGPPWFARNTRTGEAEYVQANLMRTE